MPEHVHLLLTRRKTLILERTVQLIRGGYSHAFGIEFGKHKEFCREVSRTIGFGIVQILKGTGNTFTTIPLPTGSRIGQWNIATARHIQDSNWTRCPQRLKPSLHNRESARVELVPFPIPNGEPNSNDQLSVRSSALCRFVADKSLSLSQSHPPPPWACPAAAAQSSEIAAQSRCCVCRTASCC